ncbi:MAG: hypothetical protein HXM39_04095 [Lachnoanaerobaculum sp.]|nr:hypothetical protein [Lachnoanaerobaculum sp.]DAT03287.1 MAG TPA: hypothetical protein [Caudoviricetes sp.]
MDVKKEDVIVKEDPKEEAVKEVAENNTESAVALINTKRESLSDVVYVGPKVSGVIQQFDTFSGNVPESIEEFSNKYNTIRALFIPISDFAKAFREVKEKGSALYNLYMRAKEEINDNL